MQKEIKARFNNAILEDAMRRYGISRDRVRELDGFESFIYEFERDSGAYILRIGHSARRSESLIRGEVDWMNYLADRGASVARAILSGNGNLVEAFPDGHGEHFLGTAFVRATGKSPREAGWTPALFETYGETLDYLNRNAPEGAVVWVAPGSHNVMIYHQLHGRLRKDIRFTAETVRPSVLDAEVSTVAVPFQRASLIVYQSRQTTLGPAGYGSDLATWLDERTPGFEVRYDGTPLIRVYQNTP